MKLVIIPTGLNVTITQMTGNQCLPGGLGGNKHLETYCMVVLNEKNLA